jgi:hypothetical protein
MASIKPFIRGTYPLIEGNDRIYFEGEFRKIEECLRSIIEVVKAPTALDSEVIASGVVTVDSAPNAVAFVGIDTEGAAGTDDLNTINWTGAVDGQILIIFAVNSARTVVAKDGTGNLVLSGDMTLDNADDLLTLQYGGGSFWEIARSNNSA